MIKAALLALLIIFCTCGIFEPPKEKIVTEYEYITVINTVSDGYSPFFQSAGVYAIYDYDTNEYFVRIWVEIVLRDTLKTYTDVKLHGRVTQPAKETGLWSEEKSNDFYKDWEAVKTGNDPIVFFNKENQRGFSKVYFPVDIFPDPSLDNAEWFFYLSWKTADGKFLGRRISGKFK